MLKHKFGYFLQILPLPNSSLNLFTDRLNFTATKYLLNSKPHAHNILCIKDSFYEN